ncbi:hypothetical protein GCM10010372_15280 [Streptomyces tauricus]|nr:hypothetical protein GCM10010372_15280 [Streptomyces tauricus]
MRGRVGTSGRRGSTRPPDFARAATGCPVAPPTHPRTQGREERRDKPPPTTDNRPNAGPNNPFANAEPRATLNGAYGEAGVT